MVDELSGTVKVRVKGSSRFVALDDVRDIPMGSEIDARKGVVELVSVASDGGAPQTAKLLRGCLPGHPVGRRHRAHPDREAVAARRPGKAIAPRQEEEAAAVGRRQRQVPDQGQAQRGDRGRHEVARRGPLHVTLTRVVRGKVSVRDFVKSKTVTVKAGGRYTARRKR